MHEPPKVLAEAYDAWLAAQHEALRLMLAAEHAGHPDDWAEAYRWLTRIASLCQDWILEKEDPLHPTLFRSQHESRKLIVDNPDVNYYFASLSAHESFRISGQRGDAPYIGLSIGTDIFRGGMSGKGTLGTYNLDKFEIAPGGAFELILARERPPGARNWIPLPEGATQVAVRETFGNRAKQTPSTWSIELLRKVEPPRAEPEVVAEKLHTMAKHLLFVVNMCIAMFKGAKANTNRLAGAAGRTHVASKDELRTHSDADMGYAGGRWTLGEGEALRILIRVPADLVYWGLVIVNPWMESHDYRYRTTHLSMDTARKNADGSWTLVIAPESPGPRYPNWIDSGGRREGFMLMRSVLGASMHADPECEVVKLAELRGA